MSCKGGTRGLIELSLSYCKISDIGIEILKKLKFLQRLYLKETNISDKSISYIVKYFKDLQKLDISGTEITHKYVLLLNDTKLSELNISNCLLVNNLTIQSLKIEKVLFTDVNVCLTIVSITDSSLQFRIKVTKNTLINDIISFLQKKLNTDGDIILKSNDIKLKKHENLQFFNQISKDGIITFHIVSKQ